MRSILPLLWPSDIFLWGCETIPSLCLTQCLCLVLVSWKCHIRTINRLIISFTPGSSPDSVVWLTCLSNGKPLQQSWECVRTSFYSIRLSRLLPFLDRKSRSRCNGGFVQMLHVLMSRKFAALYCSMMTYKQLLIHPIDLLILQPCTNCSSFLLTLYLGQKFFNSKFSCSKLFLTKLKTLLSALIGDLVALPITPSPPLPWYMNLGCFFQYH